MAQLLRLHQKILIFFFLFKNSISRLFAHFRFWISTFGQLRAGSYTYHMIYRYPIWMWQVATHISHIPEVFGAGKIALMSINNETQALTCSCYREIIIIIFQIQHVAMLGLGFVDYIRCWVLMSSTLVSCVQYDIQN